MTRAPDRDAVVQAVRAVLQEALDATLRVAQAARDEATHGESRAENKYDTRGLEASYLAAGQGARALALRQAMASLGGPAPDALGVGSLVGLDDGRWLLMARGAGGVRVTVDGAEVSVVTPRSPLGEALVGLEVGDDVDLGAREVVITHVG